MFVNIIYLAFLNFEAISFLVSKGTFISSCTKIHEKGNISLKKLLILIKEILRRSLLDFHLLTIYY